MPTIITQIDDAERGRTILRIGGSMELADAVLLEKIALEMRAEFNQPIILDLADLDFLDSESASVLSKLKREHDFEIENLEIFLQKIINEAERK